MPRRMTEMQPETVRAKSPKKNPSLEELVKKAVRGDDEALYELCEKTAKDILFRTTYIMGNRTDAEDVAQEVLIRVFAKIRDLREPKSFNVWLGKIIANEAKRHMTETAQRDGILNIDDYLETVTEEKDDFLPQECAENGEYRKAVMVIIERLPMRQREAVIFHYYDGMSVTETAEAMNVTKQSVSKYLELAREKIKNEIGGSEGLTGKLGMLAAGPLMSESLLHGMESFTPLSDAWIQQTMLQCKGYATAITVSAPVKAAAFKMSFGLLMGTFATVFTIFSLALGIWLSDTPRYIGGSAEQIETAFDGKVIFSGGTDYGVNTVYVNPAGAQASAKSLSGEIIAVHWWITKVGDETILYSGEGGIVDDALILLREPGTNGEYMLYFRMEDESGAVHRLGSNFYVAVKSEQEE